MNSCKGVATHRDFQDMEVDGILEDMKRQGVTDARHITKFVSNMRTETATVVFTFAGAVLPEKVEIGYEKAECRPFIQNPRRCFRFQLYGHHGNACRASKLFCARCAGEDHKVDECESLTEKCRNCEGAHSTTSRDCPAWKLEKEVCTVKATESISYFDARKKVKAVHDTPAPNVSFASTVNAKPVMHSVTTQTDLPPPCTHPSIPTPAARSANTATTTTTTPTLNTSATTTLLLMLLLPTLLLLLLLLLTLILLLLRKLTLLQNTRMLSLILLLARRTKSVIVLTSSPSIKLLLLLSTLGPQGRGVGETRSLPEISLPLALSPQAPGSTWRSPLVTTRRGPLVAALLATGSGNKKKAKHSGHHRSS